MVSAEYWSISGEAWNLLIQAAVLLAVIIGAIVGVRQLREVANQSRFAATHAFHTILRENAELFRTVLVELTPRRTVEQIEDLGPEVRARARLAVNTLNDLGQMLEERMIDGHVFFGLTHSQVIRLAYVLKPFCLWEEERIGGRFGRRLDRLDVRAKRYHDSSPLQRPTVLYIQDAGGRVEVYRTDARNGLSGVVHRLGWWWRRKRGAL